MKNFINYFLNEKRYTVMGVLGWYSWAFVLLSDGITFWIAFGVVVAAIVNDFRKI